MRISTTTLATLIWEGDAEAKKFITLIKHWREKYRFDDLPSYYYKNGRFIAYR